jgi:CoA:oxalate CoA-transferase
VNHPPTETPTSADISRERPLRGLRILDLTQFLSGPYCTQTLADLGAEVTKVETPQGDLARHIPPHFIDDDSVYYLSVNRNKRSVVIDVKSTGGRALLKQLAQAHDIIIENFRPGVVKRLGLDVDALRKERPDLIWCSISGFGQDGPYRDRPAYDMIVQAASGGMSLTGESDGKPVRAGIPIADICAGLYAVIGVLAALQRRNSTGKGDFVDISMLDCQAAMLSYQAAYFLYSGKVPSPQGTGHDSIATYRRFTAGDGLDLVVTANTERMWQGLCRALGCSELSTHPDYNSLHRRHDNRIELWKQLETIFLRRPADEWVALLQDQEVPVAVINSLDRVMTDPQIQHRGMVREIRAADGRSIRVMGNPILFRDVEAVDDQFPPKLGEDTAIAMKELLGLSADEIEALARSGAIVLSGGAESIAHEIDCSGTT